MSRKLNNSLFHWKSKARDEKLRCNKVRWKVISIWLRSLNLTVIVSLNWQCQRSRKVISAKIPSSWPTLTLSFYLQRWFWLPEVIGVNPAVQHRKRERAVIFSKRHLLRARPNAPASRSPPHLALHFQHLRCSSRNDLSKITDLSLVALVKSHLWWMLSRAGSAAAFFQGEKHI